ncbi:aromatic ring-opening dioxygenase LigA [Streptomyces nitrosporeus]|uniref:aromatic ring-opening dioxygenase LigA n=1 Tax=Streptomyces nitrosporeus TaxID=28894 RepID=UPI0039A10A8B
MTPHARLDRARQLLDAPPPAAVLGQLAVPAEDQPPACGHGNPGCGSRPVRLYPCGHRCEEHQPSKTRPFYTRKPQ